VHKRNVLAVTDRSSGAAAAAGGVVTARQATPAELTTPEKLHFVMRRGGAPDGASELDRAATITTARAVEGELTTPEKLHLIMRRAADGDTGAPPQDTSPRRRRSTAPRASRSGPARRQLSEGERSAPSDLAIENWELTTAPARGGQTAG